MEESNITDNFKGLSMSQSILDNKNEAESE